MHYANINSITISGKISRKSRFSRVVGAFSNLSSLNSFPPRQTWEKRQSGSLADPSTSVTINTPIYSITMTGNVSRKSKFGKALGSVLLIYLKEWQILPLLLL
jgi:hypothetical protein